MTETAALPRIEGSNLDEAKTNRVLAVSLGATINTPLAFILVPGVTAPVPIALELTLQFTEVGGLLKPEVDAVNCIERPVIIVWLKGLTVMEVTTGTTTVTKA